MRRLLLAAAFIAFASTRRRSSSPPRPVTLIVPWPPGGSTDIAMRALATATEKHLGQSIVIENRPGAAGTLGPGNMAATARPDGYTVAQLPITVFRLPTSRIRRSIRRRTSPTSSTSPATRSAWWCSADAPWKTFQDLIDYAKANPGKVNYGTPGAGSSLHITMEQIAKQRASSGRRCRSRAAPTT